MTTATYMPEEAPRGLESLISEIVLRCVGTVCFGFSAARVEAVAWPLRDAVVELVISAENQQQQQRGVGVGVAVEGSRDYPLVMKADSYASFDLMCRILDHVELEIPIVGQIEVIGAVSRSQRSRIVEKPRIALSTRTPHNQRQERTDDYEGPNL